MALSSDDANRLAECSSELLTPAALTDFDGWRSTAVHVLRRLVDADCACVALEGDSSSFVGVDLDHAAVRQYAEHYALVDHGIARQRAHAIEIWSRDTLWEPAELRASEYYNDFVRPHGLHDTVGIAALVKQQCLRVSLLFAGRRVRRRTKGRLRLLARVLPAFRAATELGLSIRERYGTMGRVIEHLDKPVALCSPDGRQRHRNAALVRLMVVSDGDNAEALNAAITRVALAVGAVKARSRVGDSIVTERYVAEGRWRVVGARVEWDLGGNAPMILVSVAPQTA
jgi:hypothetical protein